MRQITTIVIFILMTTGMTKTLAQSSSILQYTINFPMGNTNDFIGTTSFRGATFDYRHGITPNVGIGFSLGWYTFYEKTERGTHTSSDGSLAANGVLYRYINSVPFYVIADYYLTPAENFSPFFGLGLGVTYNRLDNEIGLYYIQDEAWQFSIAPEAGVRYGLRPEMWGYLSVRYNNSFKSSDVDGQSFLSLNIGLMFGTF